MITFYVTTVITFLDNTIDDDNPLGEDPYDGTEINSFLVRGRNEFTALEKAFKKSVSDFKKELYNKDIAITSFAIETFYETDDYARA